MPVHLIDLLAPTIGLPDRVIVVTNIVVDWLLASTPLTSFVPRSVPAMPAVGARDLVEAIQRASSIGLVRATSFDEACRALLKTY